jgi:hypothetical protein
MKLYQVVSLSLVHRHSRALLSLVSFLPTDSTNMFSLPTFVLVVTKNLVVVATALPRRVIGVRRERQRLRYFRVGGMHLQVMPWVFIDKVLPYRPLVTMGIVGVRVRVRFCVARACR